MATATARRPPLIVPFAITATALMANTLMAPALPNIIEAFDLPTGVWDGILVASASVAGVIVAPVVGVLADHHGRRRVLIPALIVYGVFGTAAAFSPDIWVLLGCRVLMGVGSAGLVSLAIVVIGDYWQGVDRARAIGQNAAVLTTTVAVFPAIGGGLTVLGGWRWSFAPFPLALLTAVLVALTLPPDRPHASEGFTAQLRDAWPYLWSRRMVVLTISGFVLFVLIFGLFLTVMPEHLESQFGLSPGWRGLVIAVPAAGSTLTALTLGRLRMQYSARALVLVSVAFFAVPFLIIGLAPWLIALLAGAFLYGIAEGLGMPTLQDLVAGSAPAVNRGAAVSFFVGAARFGQTLGPLSFGALMGATSTSGAFVAGAAVAALLGVGLASVKPEVLEDGEHR
ncbi:MAG: Bacillibactin exporter [Acidimicrobiales bacterium]|nr:MAG: MFS transporter [Actinomycetota bacterium]MBV6507510.1 Bacillibactin exporter [Acidimicrobiales bacterium]RIK07885.1 MAG: hypothetical protein DCC48_02735 [Acidobacteriota bacterium]